jgi:Zn-dependent M28 family amino/carboxypeptidase
MKTLLPLLLSLTLSGCTQPSRGQSAPPNATPSAAPADASPIAFDSTRAFSDLKKQVAFGPRVPNSPGHVACRDWILAELKAALGKSARQDFSLTLDGKKLAMSNIVGQLNPSAKKQVMLCAHWDTRPSADQEIDDARRRQPIAGANDGASGVAVLLELARQLAKNPPKNVGVQFVFFDGEDYGPGIERMFLGASHYAKRPALPKPDYAVLIDMIGDKDLQIPREPNSERMAPEVLDKIFGAAKSLGVKEFVNVPGPEIMDDHLPLQAVGWKAVDLIDFDYAPWHTLDDTPVQCSPASLKAVGDVLARVLHDEK